MPGCLPDRKEEWHLPRAVGNVFITGLLSRASVWVMLRLHTVGLQARTLSSVIVGGKGTVGVCEGSTCRSAMWLTIILAFGGS